MITASHLKCNQPGGKKKLFGKNENKSGSHQNKRVQDRKKIPVFTVQTDENRDIVLFSGQADRFQRLIQIPNDVL